MRKASPADFDTVVEITSRAFEDDPVMKWFLRKDDRYTAAVRIFFRTVGRFLMFEHRETYINDAGTGATMWLPPGVTMDVSLSRRIRSLPHMIRAIGFGGIRQWLQMQALTDSKHPKHPHYYLFSIASEPEQQGQGIGASLMEPMTARFDEQNIGAYLENSRTANLPFYQRHGFEVTEEIQLPNDGPPMWLMWRKPRSS